MMGSNYAIEWKTTVRGACVYNKDNKCMHPSNAKKLNVNILFENVPKAHCEIERPECSVFVCPLKNSQGR
jgi:hypothetical protein